MEETMKIIAFNGPRSSGKDTVANHLVNHFHVRGIPHSVFTPANALHRIMENIYPGWISNWPTQKDLPNPDIPMLENRTMRETLVKFSDVMKSLFGDGVFTNAALAKFVNDSVPIGIITDIGVPGDFNRLLEYVPRNSILLVRLVRKGFDFSSDCRVYVAYPDLIVEGDDADVKCSIVEDFVNHYLNGTMTPDTLNLIQT